MLNPKQKRFCEEYVIDLNATQASIRAGYSKKSAKEIGYELLTKPHIQEGIAELRAKVQERTQVTLDNVIKELALIAFQDMGNLFDDDGGLKHISDLPSDVTRTLSEVTSRFEQSRAGYDGEPAEIVKIKGVDKKGALDMLMKHLGGYTADKVDDKPIKVTFERINSNS